MTALLPLVEQAAGNIAGSVGIPASKTVSVLYSPSTGIIANAVVAELRKRNLQVRDILATEGDESATELVSRTLEQIEGTSGYVILLDPSFAPTVFDILGRPDRGLKRESDHLFCDWFIRPEGLIRTYAVDLNEQERFRRWLHSALAGGRSVRVTTPSGTEITLAQRSWNDVWGEVYTAPVEEVSNGTIMVDGFVYYGPAKEPFPLRIKDGRIVNLDELSRSDPQLEMLWSDLTSDGQASVLAELGIGVSLGADRFVDLMEAEQARGTCHFGFGNNVPFGGRNVSSSHRDVGVMDPTIEVDGKVICLHGRFTSYDPRT